jgi:hypothetical protein
MRNAYDGIFDRLNADSGFRAIFGTAVGEDVPVFPDWPDVANLSEADFPRVALLVPVDKPNRAIRESEASLDFFLAKTGAMDTMADIDEALVRLFDDANWFASSLHYHTRVIGGGSRPEDDELYHWHRRLAVMTSLA